MERGAMASNGVNGSPKTCTANGTCTAGTGIQGEFNLSNFEDGVLSSAFVVGLLIGCPIFASLSKRLIGFGLSVWMLAVIGCGLSFSFWFIAICRMVVGIGEASFVSLAAPFIDDNAPAKQRTAWLGIFYMCISTGYAIGYVYGGLVGDHLKWRYAFFGVAILMFPFIILGWIMKPLQLKEPESPKMNQRSRFLKDMKDLLREKTFIVSVLGISFTLLLYLFTFLGYMFACELNLAFVFCTGYTAYNFVIGAYSYWGPKAGRNIYKMENADMIFGGVTIICGILGTLAGGFLLDYLTSTIRNAFKLLTGAVLAGAIFCFSAFCFKNMYGFLVFFGIGEVLVFATQAPVNYVCLHCVKPSLRPLSMAISTVAIHLFGDVPSSPLVGLLQDQIHSWRKTSLILTSFLFLAAAFWFIGVFMKSVDRYNEEESNEHASESGAASDTRTGALPEGKD
ncbi:unnamed protein product [Linum tenue]|uniref:Major facilitator superfamily (MFS) profile domain-containing protein n=1 Tax=Linum tenue TaxID=586396 RepID=A0AAV0RFU0_9ROSI|nr:unnamed protein product [Linum tenue]